MKPDIGMPGGSALNSGKTIGKVAVLSLLILSGCAAREDSPTLVQHEGHNGIADLDPSTLPMQATSALESTVILRGRDGRGNETIVHRTIRAPGTRAPVHYHDNGGTTCVLEGEMTLYLNGEEPDRAVAGDCYYMPPDVQMSGVNSGSQNAVLLDIFTVPIDAPVWRVVEEGALSIQDQFTEDTD